jgi:alpha-galactosidase
MTPTTRIAFIGAGSIEFTRDLLGDLLGFIDLGPLEIALHDIDDERLRTGEAMARWTAGQLNASPTITTHADRRAALDGADFAINMIQVGGHAATLKDFEIPARHGLRQTIGDTLGIGGIFRALRTIPVMLGIGRDMAELCPDAWLLNYTNPMAMLCQAYAHGSPHAKIVGLCHSVQHTTRRLAELTGTPFEEVTFLGAGVNHQAFILRFERDGEDLYPRLDEAIAADPELQRTVRVEMYRRFGYFPTESSEHSAEYLPWLMHDDAALEHFRIPVNEYVRRSEENLAVYEEIKQALASDGGLEIERSLEYAPVIIRAMATGEPSVIYGNVRNDGLIDNLPAGACVEVPCLIDRTGVQPTRVGALPAQCAALNRTFLNVVELTVRAALEEDRELVHQAALLDPNASASLDMDTIRTVCDELLEAHADVLAPGLRRAVGAAPAHG